MKPETMNKKLQQLESKLQSISHNVPEERPEPLGSDSYTGYKQPSVIAPDDMPGYTAIGGNPPEEAPEPFASSLYFPRRKSKTRIRTIEFSLIDVFFSSVIIGLVIVGVIVFATTYINKASPYEKFETNHNQCLQSEIFAENECYDIAYTAVFGD